MLPTTPEGIVLDTKISATPLFRSDVRIEFQIIFRHLIAINFK